MAKNLFSDDLCVRRSWQKDKREEWYVSYAVPHKKIDIFGITNRFYQISVVDNRSGSDISDTHF